MIALLAASLGAAPALAQDPNVLKVATTANITTWDPVASFSTEAFYSPTSTSRCCGSTAPGSEPSRSPRHSPPSGRPATTA